MLYVVFVGWIGMFPSIYVVEEALSSKGEVYIYTQHEIIDII